MGITIGVTGSIAAIKTPAILSNIMEQTGTLINCITTKASRDFIGPSALGPFCDALYNDEDYIKETTLHIEIARDTRIFLIVPATANTIAKIANGIADNFLTQIVLALDPNTPKFLCPAMNTKMYNNPATHNNIRKLIHEYKWTLIPPIVGKLACGGVGMGVLARTQTIVDEVVKEYNKIRERV